MNLPNTVFDNSPQPSSSRLAAVRDHLPIVLLVGGAAALFVSLHAAATTVVIAAAGHALAGLTLLSVRQLRRSHSLRVGNDDSNQDGQPR